MITPTCDMCNVELDAFGAIVLGPPNEEGKVHKYHVCTLCYPRIEKLFIVEDEENPEWKEEDFSKAKPAKEVLPQEVFEAFSEAKRVKAIQEAIKSHTENLLAQGPEACREYLIGLGIYNEDGTLHENYGGESENDC